MIQKAACLTEGETRQVGNASWALKALIFVGDRSLSCDIAERIADELLAMVKKG